MASTTLRHIIRVALMYENLISTRVFCKAKAPTTLSVTCKFALKDSHSTKYAKRLPELVRVDECVRTSTRQRTLRDKENR